MRIKSCVEERSLEDAFATVHERRLAGSLENMNKRVLQYTIVTTGQCGYLQQGDEEEPIGGEEE